MKLVCTVSIGNRLYQTANRRYSKSTLALCKHPKCDVYYMILFTSQNKSGKKYELKDNVLKVLTRYVYEGRFTIQLAQPPHDLYIEADEEQVKAFLHLLKRILENKVREGELTYSSMSVTPVPVKDMPQKKLTITERSGYPPRGFPRTLEVLRISDMNRDSVDKGILKLRKLKILDLSNNCIEFLPTEINSLPSLRELYLAGNMLGKVSPSQWNWIGGALSKNLKLLDISRNGMKFLPDNIIQLNNLLCLDISYNDITVLPSGIGNLRCLKKMLASDNKLSALPCSVRHWNLENIDIANNNLRQNNQFSSVPKFLPISSLKDAAASKVLSLRLHYSTENLPETIIRYLNLAKYCICGKACFDVYIYFPNVMPLSSITQRYSMSAGYSSYVPIDCHLCSISCLHVAFNN